MRKIWIGVLVFVAHALYAEQQFSIESVKLTILTFNDIYDINPQNGHLGVAGLKTLLDRERRNADRYITAVNGDFLSPSVYSSLYQGKHMIDIFNLLEIDVVTFGNHEFDFGLDILEERIRDSNFIWLGTNVLDIHTGHPFANTESTMIFQIGTINFGLMGLTTTETMEVSNTSKEIIIAPIILSAQAAVHQLKKKGADVVIALTHLNIAEDMLLARNVPEIDVILGGHDHEPMAVIEGDTLIFKSGMNGKFLGRIDLNVEKKQLGDRIRTSIYPCYQLIPNHGHTSDEGIKAKVEEFREYVEAKMVLELGKTSVFMSTKGVRKEENAFANLVTDALRQIYNADIGIINAGAIRGGRDYPSGYGLTRSDIQQELPFGNIAVLTEISGKNLYHAVEHALSKLEDRNGCYLHYSGMRVVYDSGSQPGQRVREIFINDQPLNKNGLYRVATIDYLVRSGDGNFWFSNGKTVIDSGSGKLLVDITCDHIRGLEVIHPVTENRIVEISESREPKLIDLGDRKRIQLRF
ncbi:MAG: bifunctional metallophosphatase/5'-nucleotidase [Simkania sp.]|nr:bifunctional metallophosphatase/5'-nucleotidase [Simkania sp.]